VIGATVRRLQVRFQCRTQSADTFDVFPCHGVGGLTGMLLTAGFASSGGLIHGGVELLGVHVLAMVIVVIAVYVMSHLIYRLVDAIHPIRVTEEEEERGLDLSQHDETIYTSGQIPPLRAAPAAPPN